MRHDDRVEEDQHTAERWNIYYALRSGGGGQSPPKRNIYRALYPGERTSERWNIYHALRPGRGGKSAIKRKVNRALYPSECTVERWNIYHVMYPSGGGQSSPKRKVYRALYPIGESERTAERWNIYHAMYPSGGVQSATERSVYRALYPIGESERATKQGNVHHAMYPGGGRSSTLRVRHTQRRSATRHVHRLRATKERPQPGGQQARQGGGKVGRLEPVPFGVLFGRRRRADGGHGPREVGRAEVRRQHAAAGTSIDPVQGRERCGGAVAVASATLEPALDATLIAAVFHTSIKPTLEPALDATLVAAAFHTTIKPTLEPASDATLVAAASNASIKPSLLGCRKVYFRLGAVGCCAVRAAPAVEKYRPAGEPTNLQGQGFRLG